MSRKKNKLQVFLVKEALERLDEIVGMGGYTTRSQVVRDALSLYHEVVKVKARGGKFGFLENGTLTYYMLPIMAEEIENATL